jgi:NADPH:quinone reductase-like Zn-dependent oxidoreductase
MKAYQIQAYNSLDTLQLIDLPEPNVVANKVLVKIKANSIDYSSKLIFSNPLGSVYKDKIKMTFLIFFKNQ